MLLQILDDGRLTDSHGRTVDFKNTVIIMTSNLGSAFLIEGITEQGEFREGVQEQVMDLVRGHFKPEFLNRIDEIVFFRPLLAEQLKAIIELLLQGLRARLAERKVNITLTDKAKEFIAETAYSPTFGARPLRRYLQQHVETPLAKVLIGGHVEDGAEVQVDVEDGKLVFG